MLSVIVSSSCCIILQCDINFIACTCYKARQIAFSALILQKFRMWSHGGPWFCITPNVVLWTLGIQFEINQTGASQNVIVVVVKHRSSSLITWGWCFSSCASTNVMNQCLEMSSAPDNLYSYIIEVFAIGFPYSVWIFPLCISISNCCSLDRTLGHTCSCWHQQSDCKLTGIDLHLCVCDIFPCSVWLFRLLRISISNCCWLDWQSLTMKFQLPKLRTHLTKCCVWMIKIGIWFNRCWIMFNLLWRFIKLHCFAKKSGMNRNHVANNVQTGGWWIKTNITSASSASPFSKVFQCFHTLPFGNEREWQSFLEAFYLLWYGLDIPMQIFLSMDTPMWNCEWQKVKTCHAQFLDIVPIAKETLKKIKITNLTWIKLHQ